MMKRVTPELRELYESVGQQHVFEFLDRGMLSSEEESELATQLAGIDIKRAISIFENSFKAEKPASEIITPVNDEEVVTLDRIATHESDWTNIAYRMMADQKIAFLILGGGQGTRLGVDYAKGMYDIQLPSHKSIFQLQAERLAQLHNVVKRHFPESKPRIPLYLMTSPINHTETQSYFEEHSYFGLSPDDVRFFVQDTLPCFTKDGKVIMEHKHCVAQSPDGNGGIYRSLFQSGMMNDLQKRGIEYVHVTAIDNALVRVADPVFLGYCKSINADVGNKGCSKISWNERVGVMALRNGKYSVVEYSEIGDEHAKLQTADGRLAFSIGNICNHIFSFNFLKDVALPKAISSYHVAEKKIPFANPETGETEKPSSNNGIKLELFIFDVFPFSERMAILECERSAEFGPVKNAPGSASDSPETAKRMLMQQHAKWLKNAGAIVDDSSLCEISPRVSIFGENLESICTAMNEAWQFPCLVCRSDETGNHKDARNVSKRDAEVQISHFVNESNCHVYVVRRSE